MYDTILIYNDQAFGDALIGTHLARLLKDKYPESNIIFAIPPTMNLTTSKNQKDGLIDIINILSLQYGIDGVYLLESDGEIITIDHKHGYVLANSPDLVLEQREWWGNLGIVGSNILPYYKLENLSLNRKNMNTETKFNVGTKKVLPERLTVVTQGPYEWERKLNNSKVQQQVVNEIKKYANVIELDVKTHNGTYLEALQIANNCNLFIGPIGSLAHACAGLGLDTISITSVFPNKYDSPEYYKKIGYHDSIYPKKENHCGSFKCITTKNYDPNNEITDFGNPPVDDFWAKKCDYMEDGLSCISKYTVEDIMNSFLKWYEQWK